MWKEGHAIASRVYYDRTVSQSYDNYTAHSDSRVLLMRRKSMISSSFIMNVDTHVSGISATESELM